jgi:hypothetical protein
MAARFLKRQKPTKNAKITTTIMEINDLRHFIQASPGLRSLRPFQLSSLPSALSLCKSQKTGA